MIFDSLTPLNKSILGFADMLSAQHCSTVLHVTDPVRVSIISLNSLQKPSQQNFISFEPSVWLDLATQYVICSITVRKKSAKCHGTVSWLAVLYGCQVGQPSQRQCEFDKEGLRLMMTGDHLFACFHQHRTGFALVQAPNFKPFWVFQPKLN